MKVKENIKLYTNNRIAKLQGENDFDGIIAVADEMLAVNLQDALAQKIRLQALFDKKDYAGVIASAEEAAAVQTDEEERSDVLFHFGCSLQCPHDAPAGDRRPFESNGRCECGCGTENGGTA